MVLPFCVFDFLDVLRLLPLRIFSKDSKSIDKRLTLSATSYLECIHGDITGRPPEIDCELEKSIQTFLRNSINEKFVASAHDISDGGLAIALAECCIASDFGANCEIPNSNHRLDRLLFGEGGARILLSISPQNEIAWKALLKEVNEKTKQMREMKTQLGKNICNYMTENNLNDHIEISDGELRFFEKKEYTPLSFGYIEKRLHEIIADDEQVNFIIKYLKDKRETNVSLDIKRHYNK